MIKKIKICGVKDPKDISVCNELGIDFIGFNFADISPRKIKPSEADKNNLSSYCKKIDRVAVFVDPSDQYLDKCIRSIDATYIQLHGNESTKRCLDINSSLKFKKIFNKKNVIFIEHLKGSIFINQRTNHKIKIKIKIVKNLISNFKHKIYTNIFDRNKFILQSFS